MKTEAMTSINIQPALNVREKRIFKAIKKSFKIIWKYISGQNQQSIEWHERLKRSQDSYYEKYRGNYFGGIR